MISKRMVPSLAMVNHICFVMAHDGFKGALQVPLEGSSPQTEVLPKGSQGQLMQYVKDHGAQWLETCRATLL